MWRESHAHRPGSLCTKRSNNNGGGFIGFSEVGGGRIFLKNSHGRDPLVTIGLLAVSAYRIVIDNRSGVSAYRRVPALSHQ